MMRTQIQITEEQAAALRALSAAQGVSVAQLIRRGIDSVVRHQSGLDRKAIIARAESVVGRFRSGSPDGSSDHDKHLADAFGAR